MSNLLIAILLLISTAAWAGSGQRGPETVGPQEYCEQSDPNSTAVGGHISPDGKMVIVCIPPSEVPTPKQAADWCAQVFGTELVRIAPTGYIYCAKQPGWKA